MIERVTINNRFGKTLTINLSDTQPSHGLFISGIDGLGTVQADIRMSKAANRHGELYNSSRAYSRDIVFHVLYVDGYDKQGNYVSAAEARVNSYRFFPLGEKITVVFYTDYVSSRGAKRSVRAVGYVEHNEPDIFVEPLSGATITLRCPSPWFAITGDKGTQVASFSDLMPAFEFPVVSVQSATDVTWVPKLEFTPLAQDVSKGTKIFTKIMKNEKHHIYYEGEVRTGMIISIIADNWFRGITIYNIGTGEKMFINTDTIEKMFIPGLDPDATIRELQIHQGDEIRINTDPDHKWIRYYSDGNVYNILNAVDLDCDWLTLNPGDNVFSYECKEDTDFNVSITMTADVYVEGL